jgi:hypothetical protein
MLRLKRDRQEHAERSDSWPTVASMRTVSVGSLERALRSNAFLRATPGWQRPRIPMSCSGQRRGACRHHPRPQHHGRFRQRADHRRMEPMAWLVVVDHAAPSATIIDGIQLLAGCSEHSDWWNRIEFVPWYRTPCGSAPGTRRGGARTFHPDGPRSAPPRVGEWHEPPPIDSMGEGRSGRPGEPDGIHGRI